MDGGTLQSLLAVPATDIGGQWLAGLVPEGSPLAAALSIFGSILSAIAAAALGYYMIAGTVATAHDGKVLGAKWHTIWAPVRVIVGLGLLVPIGGGLGGGERAVLELAKAGNGLASTVWVTFVEAVAQDGGTLPPPQSIAGAKVARMVWESETCVAVIDKLLPQGNTGLDPRVAATFPALPPASPGDGEAVWDYGLCGRVSLASPGDNPDTAAWAKARAAAISSMVTEMRASGTLDAVAASAVQVPSLPWPTGIAAYLDALGQRYDKAAQQAASTYIASRDRDRRSKIVDHARAQGWLSAGELWTTLRDLSQAVANEANRLPDRQPVRLQELGRRNGLGDLVAAAKEAYGRVRASLPPRSRRRPNPRLRLMIWRPKGTPMRPRCNACSPR
ncbi:DotA/TraY family protein [Caenispirillum bisanense]|uniref:DotA/TraY family protein n=1 Tax=Caenispirillum bisanense TaxID=414052 RepID=UPI0031D6613D